MAFTRVLLVDDLVMRGEVLALRLSTVADMLMLGRHDTGDPELFSNVSRLRPDVIVIDVGTVAPPVRRLLRGLRTAWPPAHIVALTETGHLELAVESARAGVSAWVDTASSTEHLVTVLRGVGRGEAWFPPAELGAVLRAVVDDRDARDRRGRLTTLTGRERDVLRGISEGKSPRMIATELSISLNTVRSHTSRILSKLGVHRRLAAASIAAAEGISDADEGGQLPLPDVADIHHSQDSPQRSSP
jgi:two-component system nitrate/nitrite response regulator NarL